MMVKKIFVLLIICVSFLVNTSTVFAENLTPGKACRQNVDVCIPTNEADKKFYDCLPYPPDSTTSFLCQPSLVPGIFGKIQAPDALKGLIGKDPTGAGGISTFLSNLIALIYSLAAIVLIFMLIWGAFEWMTSGGEKEKIESARRRIISALIGILLFAIAFAVIQVLGTFTGFTFFAGQK